MQEVKEIIAEAAQIAFGQSDVAIDMAYTEPRFGDFATNLPFQLAAQLKRPPQELAAQLASAIKDERVERAEAAGGFVNLRMSDHYWLKQLSRATQKPTQAKPQKIQVEFISANPTGPLTLANARGGYPGDVLANILSHLGHQVSREYYINDAGGQINQLAKSVKSRAGLEVEGEVQYNGDYIQALADKLKPTTQTADADLGQQAVKELLADIKRSVERMGIKFDEWVSESKVVKAGGGERVIERLQSAELAYEQDGAVWLASTKLGDERDRVLRKSDGEATYLMNDLAAHIELMERRGFDRAIKIWGADHAGQVASLKFTIEKLVAGSRLDVVLVQFVRLVKNGQEVKISKRAGTFVTVDDLLDAIGGQSASDIARFMFLMRSADSHMDFDLDLAKETSQKNPYWYVMYAFVRANSILDQAAKRKLPADGRIKQLDDKERLLVALMSRWPQLLADIESDYGVHRLTFYGLELAKAFHDLYESQRIIDLEPEKAAQKLHLIQLFVDFFTIYCQVLGVQPIAKM